MGTTHSLRRHIAAIMEWPAVDKGLILLLTVIPLHLQFLSWSVYVLTRPDRDALVNVDYMLESMQVQIGLIFLGMVIAAGGFVLRRRSPDLLLYQHITLQFFAISLVLMGYTIGTNSFPAGIVMLGAPLFGFILLDRFAVWLSTAVGLSTLVGLSYAGVLGWIPHAPVRIVATTLDAQRFWLNSELFFATPFLVLIAVMADQMLTWWRIRETRIREMSRTDALTNLHNRRSILELLDQEMARCARDGRAFSVVILDLDHFKRVNDTWGHPTGDRVLQAAARLLRQSVRSSDHVGRYGGEEFMIILPETTPADALPVIERCRVALTEAGLLTDGGEPLPISGSFGLSGMTQGQALVSQQLVQRADEALYAAKAAGRNRIMQG